MRSIRCTDLRIEGLSHCDSCHDDEDDYGYELPSREIADDVTYWACCTYMDVEPEVVLAALAAKEEHGDGRAETEDRTVV